MSKTKLKTTVAQIERDFGKEALQPPGKKKITPIPAISTSCLQLDIALGIGGVPEGRIVEIYGPESAGKTTLVYHLLAQAQAKGGTCAFIDAEHSADPQYATALGVNWDQLYFAQPSCGEEGLGIAHRLAKTGEVKLIAIDSIAALTPRREVEGEVGDQAVGLQARMMGQAVRMLAPVAEKSGTTIVFTNQIRERVGVVFGSPETQPGGRAVKFFSSVRMDIRRKETVGSGNDSTANRVKVKVVKNKVAPPYREAEFEIVFGKGIDRNASIIDLTTDPSIPGYTPELVRKSGSYFYFQIGGEEASVQGRSAAIALLADNPEYADDLYNRIMEANK